LTNDELTELAGLKDAFTQLNAEVTARSDRREAAYGAADELASLVDEPDSGVRHPEGDPDEEGEKTPNIEPVFDPLRKDPVEQPEAPAEDRELIAASANAPKTPKLGDVAKAAPKMPAGKPP